MDRVWRNIEWWEWLYQINIFGEIKSLNRNIIMKISKSKYCVVTLESDKKKKQYRLHTLLAKTFIPNPENKKTVNHKDGNKFNNNIDNLEWATMKEQNIHRYNVLWFRQKEWFENKASRNIVQLSKDWELIKIWPSWKQIYKQLWYDARSIIRCCKWISKVEYWFIRKYL